MAFKTNSLPTLSITGLSLTFNDESKVRITGNATVGQALEKFLRLRGVFILVPAFIDAAGRIRPSPDFIVDNKPDE